MHSTTPSTSTAASAELSDTELLRYSRHLLLDDWGFEAQTAIAHKTVAIIGAGGLGSAAALALVSAGIGQLLLVDDDVVELSNLQRQILHDSASLGLAKVDSAQQRLHAVNPHVPVRTLHARLDADSMASWVAQADVVLDCSDNLATRQQLNVACVAAGKALISGSAIRWRGQLFIYQPDGHTPCYHCLYPQTGADAVTVANEPCATMGVFAPLVMSVGSWQAGQALRLLAGLPVAAGQLQLLDMERGNWQQLQLQRQAACPICAH